MMLKNNLTKVFGSLALVFVCMFTSIPSASAGSGAAAHPSLNSLPNRGYVEGGLQVFAGHDFVPGASAYIELYRDGTYLGSKYGEMDNYYLDKYASALITDGVHTQSGLYSMQWSGRVEEYYLFGGDWTDSGTLNYYKN
jgi:hypothetical protein